MFGGPNKRQMSSYLKKLKTQGQSKLRVHSSVGKISYDYMNILKVIEDVESILTASSQHSLFRESLLSMASKSGNFLFCLFDEVVVHCIIHIERVAGMVINKTVNQI